MGGCVTRLEPELQEVPSTALLRRGADEWVHARRQTSRLRPVSVGDGNESASCKALDGPAERIAAHGHLWQRSAGKKGRHSSRYSFKWRHKLPLEPAHAHDDSERSYSSTWRHPGKSLLALEPAQNSSTRSYRSGMNATRSSRYSSQSSNSGARASLRSPLARALVQK